MNDAVASVFVARAIDLVFIRICVRERQRLRLGDSCVFYARIFDLFRRGDVGVDDD